jgi:peptidyl-prolyl cis-trans isomerase C
MTAGIAALYLRAPVPAQHASAASGAHQSCGMAPEQCRDYAAYLEQKNMPVPALDAYRMYLNNAQLDADARAKTLYAMAKLAMDSEQHEKALAFLYEAEFLAPNSQLKPEIGQKIVTCLDKLGRSATLRRELRSRTIAKRTAADLKEGEVVLAEFGGDILTNQDLDRELEKLPVSARESFDKPEKRQDFLRNLVAERLLVDKARRLELDKNPEVQEQLAREADQLIVRKLIRDEVQAKVKVTPEDVERFYKAEYDRFTVPATAKVRIAKASSEDAAKALTEFTAEAVLVREKGGIPGIGTNDEAVKRIFETEPGTVTAPMQVGADWVVFRVESKEAEKVRPFSEVKDEAQRMYESEKEQEQVNGLVEQTLKERDVKLYPDRIDSATKKN